MSYGILSFAFSFAPDLLKNNRDNAGSELFNLNLSLFPGQWVQSFDLYKEKGFYLQQPSFEVYLPKTRSLKVGGRTAYVLNPKFSAKALYNQNEKQVQSAGSFIPGLNWYYSEFLVQAEGENGSVRSKFYAFDVGLTPQYIYHWVPVKNVLLSAGGSLGVGMNISRVAGERLTSLLTEWSYSLAVIWDNDVFYAGGRYRHLSLNHNTDRVTHTNDQIPVFRLFVGFRFKAPKPVAKLYQKLMHTTH